MNQLTRLRTSYRCSILSTLVLFAIFAMGCAGVLRVRPVSAPLQSRAFSFGNVEVPLAPLRSYTTTENVSYFQGPGAPTNVSVFALQAVCSGVNCTTLGTLTLTPTFDNIGVKLTYTDDSNANNTATLQYRVQGSGSWLNAHTVAYSNTAHWPDRRATVSGGTSNAANQNQFRASIVGLSAGTVYEVKLTVSDSDGITGTNPVTGTVTMLSTSTLAPQSGSTKYLDTTAAGGGDGSSGTPYNTWANAMSGTACGDTLIIKATSGASAGQTFSKACAGTNWYQIQCADQSVIAFSSGAANDLIITGTGLKIYNCRFGGAAKSSVHMSTSQTDIWFDNNYFVDMNTTAPAGDCTFAFYYEAHIQIWNGAGKITITNNSFNETTHAVCTDHSTSGGGRAIMWGHSDQPSTAGRYIVKGNTFTGFWSDCIGDSPEGTSNILDDSDILQNTFNSGSCNDDTIQFEGSDINVRIGENTITVSSTGLTCIATQTGYFGPIYVYRTYCTYGGPANAYKVGGTEGALWFHNTAKNTQSGGVYCWDSSGGSGTMIYWIIVDNICQTNQSATIADLHSTGTTVDYNLHYRVSGTPIIETWDGTTNYNTIALFNTGTGQEAHGVQANPSLDSSLHITSSSPAYNAGVTIPNFNDATSAWPAANGGSPAIPDMGAFEVP